MGSGLSTVTDKGIMDLGMNQRLKSIGSYNYTVKDFELVINCHFYRNNPPLPQCHLILLLWVIRCDGSVSGRINSAEPLLRITFTEVPIECSRLLIEGSCVYLILAHDCRKLRLPTADKGLCF